MKLNAEDVEFVYVENITFAVVQKDDEGSDVLITDEGIELDSQTKAELSDQVLAHIREGKAVEIENEDKNEIVFEPDTDTFKLRGK
jgi:hypothetical protein|tara:strand:+ start:87 stop:344 length:258 start_codon:yes stop_codon:yes gene_type:complete